MDTFMDKLSQKLNAQEMIRANGEAESAQLSTLKNQVQEYQACLDRMQEVCTELGEIQYRIGTLAASQNNQTGEALENLKNQMAEIAQETEKRMESISQESTKQLDGMQQEMMGRLGQVSTGDDLHKECVKVYRNMSMTVQDEMAKQKTSVQESIKEALDPVEHKLKTLTGLAAAALVCGIIGIVMQIVGWFVF